MSELIDDLKKEHAEMKESLRELSRMDLSSKAAKKRLMQVRETFIEHIHKEDREIYPRLKQESAGDGQLLSVLTYLEEEIELISKFVFIFFDKFSKKQSFPGLEREFHLICSTLIKRIEKEEELFFPEFEKISR